MTDTINQVSSEAVMKATGKTWDEWIAFLDEKGARDMTHKEIVNLLSSGRYITNPWWCQTVTVGYEFARGSRITGQTADAGFQIGVQKTLPIPVQRAWEIITSPEGIKVWLGDAPDIQLKVGYKYRMADGVSGEIRSVKSGERIRLTWHPQGRVQPATLQVTLTASGNKTSLRFHHEKLADGKEREKMQKHWREITERLSTLSPG
jgi:uncharacterized protein YndB with AHSA1/START domain